MENLLKEFKIIKIVDTNPINYQLTFEPDLKKEMSKIYNDSNLHFLELKL